MTNILKDIDLSKSSLRKFGLTMSFCLFAIGLFLFFRHNAAYKAYWFFGLIFFGLAQILTPLLKPIYEIWMTLAFYLGWINTRVILILVYYVIVTPIGLIAKLFRKDFLNPKLDKNAQSYWQKREAKRYDKESYERIF